MTGPAWLALGALAMILVAGMLLSAAWLHRRWRSVRDVLDYRTADGFLIERQCRRLQRDAAPGVPRIGRPALLNIEMSDSPLTDQTEAWRRCGLPDRQIAILQRQWRAQHRDPARSGQ